MLFVINAHPPPIVPTMATRSGALSRRAILILSEFPCFADDYSRIETTAERLPSW